jgi:plasmid stabilization system protein ParE
MTYRVKLTAVAERDVDEAFRRIHKEAPLQAERWLYRLFEAISSLSEMPTRCSIIAETPELGREVRHLLFGKRSGVYRILFDIQETSEEGPRVRVLRIWHGSRDHPSEKDLTEE